MKTPTSPRTRTKRSAPAAAAARAIADRTSGPGRPRRRSYLAWLYESLGLLYSVIFLGLSFALVAVFVMNVLVARRDRSCRRS